MLLPLGRFLSTVCEDVGEVGEVRRFVVVWGWGLSPAFQALYELAFFFFFFYSAGKGDRLRSRSFDEVVRK